MQLAIMASSIYHKETDFWTQKAQTVAQANLEAIHGKKCRCALARSRRKLCLPPWSVYNTRLVFYTGGWEIKYMSSKLI